MNASSEPEDRSPLSPESLKAIAEEAAGVKMSDEELRLCTTRLDGLLPAIRELEQMDLGELEPLYTVLMPEED